MIIRNYEEAGNFDFPRSIDVFPNDLEEPARTCWEAAAYRNIYLSEELKSILFRNDRFLVLVNIPGDCSVDTDVLEIVTGKVKMVTSDSLLSYGLEKGRVNPFTLQSIPILRQGVVQVVCRRVFAKKYMYTNDGTLNGSIKFKTKDLIHLLDPVIVPMKTLSLED